MSLSMLLPVLSCLPAPPATMAVGDPMAELQRLIGDARCRSDNECRTIAIGTQACGGPAAFLAWSTRQTSAQALRKAAARYTRAQGAPALRDGNASTCRVLRDPGARCEWPAAGATAAAAPGHCRLRSEGELPRQ